MFLATEYAVEDGMLNKIRNLGNDNLGKDNLYRHPFKLSERNVRFEHIFLTNTCNTKLIGKLQFHNYWQTLDTPLELHIDI